MCMSYSQNNEEALILSALEQLKISTGQFLDIGAFDGKDMSNTYRLAERGWKGVCVEASPNVFPALIKNYTGNHAVTLVNAAVTAAPAGGLVHWYDSGGDAVSSTSDAHRAKWDSGSNIKFSDFWVNTLPLAQLFEQFGYSFEFINIDVESANWELFIGLPWLQLKDTRVICVEHDGNESAMKAHAALYGFSAFERNAENLLFIRR